MIAAVVVWVLLGALIVFQIALVAGAPLGRFAWGGGSTVLPTRLRVASAVSVLIYAVIAWIVAEAVSDGRSDVGIWVLTVYFTLGVALNAASRSRSERMLMTPVALLLAAGCLVVALA